jgi:hypothetical protein
MWKALAEAGRAAALRVAGRPPPAPAAAAAGAAARAAAAARQRPPALFRRMDGSEDGDEEPAAAPASAAAAAASAPAAAAAASAPAAAAAEALPPPMQLPTRDAGAAAVARAGGGGVAVTRLRPSRPGLDAGAGGEAPAVAAADARAAANYGLAVSLGSAVHVGARADDGGAGGRAFALFEAMQSNPRLLDTAAALAASPAQRMAAQMAAGVLPRAALGEALLGPAGSLPDDAGELGAPPRALPGASGAGAGAGAGAGSLVLAAAAAAEVLVPARGTVDEALLRAETVLPPAFAGWGPKPAEASAYDQLVLAPEDDDYALDRVELFELHARHRADPAFWTVRRLADHYDAKPEWVEVLLQYTSPPTYVQVDGRAYGVVEVRDMARLGAEEPPTPTASALRGEEGDGRG